MQKKKSKTKIIIALCTLAVLVGAGLYFFLNQNDTSQFREEAARRQTIETYYTFTGNVEAMESQYVLSTLNLSVKTFYVREGDHVSTGDVLFDLDDRAILSSIEQITASLEIAKINHESAQGLNRDQQTIQVNNNLASARLSHNNALQSFQNAEENHARMLVLHEAGAIAQTELNAAENARNSARSSLDSAELALSAAQKSYDNLNETINQSIRIAREQLNQAQASYDNIMRQKDDLTVKAEVSGEVVEIFVTENETLIMGTRIMHIVDYDNLKISIRVDEYDLHAVTVGKETQVTVNALDMTVPGIVDSIAREAIPLANIAYFPTSVTIASHDQIRVGLSAEVRILNQRAEDTVTISMKAIRFDDENQPYVYVWDARGRPEAHYVTVGINDAHSVEISEGLGEGDIVLVAAREFSRIMPFGPVR